MKITALTSSRSTPNEDPTYVMTLQTGGELVEVDSSDESFAAIEYSSQNVLFRIYRTPLTIRQFKPGSYVYFDPDGDEQLLWRIDNRVEENNRSRFVLSLSRAA